MADYIKWSELVARYPMAGKKYDGDDETTDSFINGAEAYVNSKLATSFTIPFTAPIPELIKDVTIDLSYAKMSIGKLDDRQELIDRADGILKALVTGDMILIDEDGNAQSTTGTGAWSEHGDYVATFNVDDSFSWEVDPDRLDDIDNDRSN